MNAVFSEYAKLLHSFRNAMPSGVYGTSPPGIHESKYVVSLMTYVAFLVTLASRRATPTVLSSQSNAYGVALRASPVAHTSSAAAK
jgi:hypothetical protein